MFADLNGARLHYEVSGTGEPVILIGGFGTNAAFWEHARTLLDGYRVVTYDNRGVGQTSCADGYSETDMAEDAIALMDHLRIEKAHVLGWSMGSHLGQIIGAEHPDRVRSLTLVSTYLRLPSRSFYILEGLTSMAVRGEAPTGCLAMAVNAFCYPESLFRRFADEGRDIPIPEKLEDPGGSDGSASCDEGFGHHGRGPDGARADPDNTRFQGHNGGAGGGQEGGRCDPRMQVRVHRGRRPRHPVRLLC